MSIPLVVGVVTYKNDREQLERLLASLDAARKASTVPFRVAWLDNSTDPAMVRLLKELGLKDVTVSSENLGFGRAHNCLMRDAFSLSSTRWYVCLNPDAIVHPDMFSELITQAGSLPRPGVVEALQFPDEHPKAYDPKTGATQWCSGCAMLISEPCFQATGGFDEEIFLYCEDVDLSWRARLAGFDIATASRALVHHYTGDRAPGGRTRIEMLRAGAYLAAKWGGDDFKRRCVTEFQELTGEALVVPQVKAPTAEMRQLADFSSSFHFANVRW